MVRKAAIALSGIVVVGVCLLFALKARSGSSEPSASPGGGAATGVLDGGASVADAGDAAPRPRWDYEEDPRWKAGMPLRPMDHDIIAALLSGHVDRKDVADVFPDRPYHVRFAGSPETQTFAFVLIDLDRDDQWDERWDLTEPGQIKRTVYHDPQALNREVMFTLVKGHWQAH